MRKVQFGLIALPSDLEDNFRAIPFGLVFDEVEMAVRNTPYNFLPSHRFGDLLGAAVNVFVLEPKLIGAFLGGTFNLFRPPPPNVVYGVKNFFGGLAHRERGGVIFRPHFCPPFAVFSTLSPCGALSGTNAVNCRSSALATPLCQPSAIDRDAGSGKISSSPFSKPSNIPAAADSVEAFGMSKPRFISVSIGPITTA